MFLHIIEIHFQNRLSGSDQIAFLDQNIKALALQLHGIDADMHKNFLPAIRHNANRMFAWEDIKYFPVNRRANHAVMRQNREPVAGHSFGEHRIGNIGNIHQFTVHRHDDIFLDDRIAVLGGLLFNLGRFHVLCFHSSTRCLAAHDVGNLRFNCVGTGSEDGLNVVADLQYAGCPQLLEGVFAYVAFVLHFNPQTGDASIQVSDILLSAKRSQNIVRQLILTHRSARSSTFRIALCIFTSRRLQVELPDNKTESEVVDHREDQTNDDDVPPWGTVWNHPENQIIDQTAGEGHPDFRPQNMHGHKRQPGKNRMHRKQNWCNEQERELERFRDPRQERGQRGRTHNPGHIFLMLRSSFVVNRQRCGWKTKHHEWEFTGHKGTGSEWHAVSQLSHKDRLVAANKLACLVHVFAEFEPERRVKDMVQTKRNQRPLNHPENKRGQRPVLFQHKVGSGVEASLDRRPDDHHQQTEKQ